MRILISTDTNSTAHYHIRLGISRAMAACGHEVVIWNINEKSPNDAFDEFSPQLFWGQTYNLSRSLVNAILERPYLKVVLRSSDWGSFNDGVDLQKYPILVANNQEKKHVETLVSNNALDFIHCHYIPKRIKETHNHWVEQLGVRVESLLSAADVFDYTNGVKLPEFECDAVFVGGYWGYKARTLEKYIVPLKDMVNLKVFGNQSWGIPEYCGSIPNDYVKHAFSSAIVCPNVSEPHSQDFGYDIIERPYKLLSNKCFVVSDYVEDMFGVFGNGMVYADSPRAFHDAVKYFVNNPEDRQEYINEGYKRVMDNHTYFHRVSNMFQMIDMPELASQTLTTYDKVKDKLQIEKYNN